MSSEKVIRPIRSLQTEIPLKRIAAYCRVSSNSDEQEESFAAQVIYYSNLIQKMENTVLVDIYADEGISGRGKEKRNDFNRMIADCLKGKIDRILTKSVSRFARNTVDCLETVRMLKRIGVTVYFEKENIDTESMSTEMLLALAGVQAQEESTSISKNVRWSYKKRMEAGDFISTSPAFGFALNRSSDLTIVPEEAAVINLMAALYLNGNGKVKISDYLNERGIYRRGKPWTPFAVRYVLNNEKLIGDSLLQKTVTKEEHPHKKINNHGEVNQFYIQNSHEPILTKSTFDQMKNLQSIWTPKLIEKGGHPLSKLLRCAECGHTYRRRTTGAYPVWVCALRSSQGKDCTLHIVAEDDVIAVLIHMVNKLRQNSDDFFNPLLKQLRRLHINANNIEENVKKLDMEIMHLRNQCFTIAKLVSSGLLDEQDFYEQTRELSSRLYKLRVERNRLTASKSDNQTLLYIKEVKDTLDELEDDITEFDEALIRSIVTHIEVVSNRILKIYLKGGIALTENLPSHARRCAG